MAKLARSWPPSSMRSTSSREMSASVRPAKGRSFMASATASTTRAAARRASTSAASFRARRGLVTREAGRNAVWGSAAWRPSTNVAQVRSPMAARPGRPARPATMATGSSVSPQGRRVKASGRSSTRGASRRGTTRVAAPSRGSTSIVSRSRGMAE